MEAIRESGSIRFVDPQLKGAPLGILFLFMLNPAVCFTEQDLGFYTSYSRPTLHRALETLARYDLVQRLGDRPVWALTEHTRQLGLGDEKTFFAGSSRIRSGETEDLLLPTTTAPDEKTFSPVAEALQRAGVYASVVAELAADPWVNEGRIAAWLERLRADPKVGSVPAVLVTNLRHHMEPGASDDDEGTDRPWLRYIQGPYADAIDY